MKFSALLQAVPPASPAGPATPSTGADGHAPHAGAPPGGALGALFPLLLILPMFAVMYFMNRSQQKKQKELEEKLKVGDRILTQSGLIGKLVEKSDRTIKVEIAPGIKVQMLRTTIVGLDSGDEKAAPASDK